MKNCSGTKKAALVFNFRGADLFLNEVRLGWDVHQYYPSEPRKRKDKYAL